MSHEMLLHLGLLADVDSLAAELSAWAEKAPAWPPARHCQALVRRLLTRVDTMRVRLDAPLVVATLGGTGTGKSTLVNALVGAEVSLAGRERPTTQQPTLVCRPGLRLASLGIDADSVVVVERDAPLLRDLVLLDCPDPDTTENDAERGTNLARLRELLPHCDVLLVATTQQKYRSARVADELAAAAAGARLVFVQTHADVDADIREDWQRVLGADYATGEMFFVDSLAAMTDLRQGVQPHGEFGRLIDLLTRELSVAASHRIRRANYLDLVGETLASCQERVAAGLPGVEQLESAIGEQRARLAARLTEQLREELLASRRSWESRLVGEVSSRWGLSPFSCVLRLYQGLGGFVASAALLRVRSAAQLALWGAMEGGRRLRVRRQGRHGETAAVRAAALGWDEADLRTAAIILEGYAAEAGIDSRELEPHKVAREAASVAGSFIGDASAQLQAVIQRQAVRHSGRVARWVYEILFTTMLAALLYRFARNFFYDSWLGPELGFTDAPQQVLGTDFFLGAGLVLLAWSGLLLWSFTARLRRGLAAEINEIAVAWSNPKLTAGFFCRRRAEVPRDSPLARRARAPGDARRRVANAPGRAGNAGPSPGRPRQGAG